MRPRFGNKAWDLYADKMEERLKRLEDITSRINRTTNYSSIPTNAYQYEEIMDRVSTVVYHYERDAGSIFFEDAMIDLCNAYKNYCKERKE